MTELTALATPSPVSAVAAPDRADVRGAAYAALLLRVGLGAVFLAHGLFKVAVLGLPATAAFFADHGYPAWTAYPVTAAEVAGGLLLLAGLWTRQVALGLLPVMAGAFLVHWPNGWYFGAPNGGWEFVGFLIVALLAQSALGDGAWAVGRGGGPRAGVR